jgi:hypothetical protein
MQQELVIELSHVLDTDHHHRHQKGDRRQSQYVAILLHELVVRKGIEKGMLGDTAVVAGVMNVQWTAADIIGVAIHHHVVEMVLMTATNVSFVMGRKKCLQKGSFHVIFTDK